MNFHKGFTLVELLIAVTIIAILSAVGFTVFGNSSQKARDGVRKNDLQAISRALELYYQANRHYPTTDGWVFSSAGTSWIPNMQPPLPVDPFRNDGDPKGNNDNLGYGYWASSQAGCPVAGQWYALVAKLEVTNGDPDASVNKTYKFCDGSAIFATPRGYAVTSDQGF